MSSRHEVEAAMGCAACEFEPFVKNNYFTGKLMGASDFIAETHFHQEKMRLHQARLHGWGVVCGLEVLQHPNADCRKRYVRIEAGSAVDCCGHDILVPEEEILDLLSYKQVAALAKENPAHLHALGICVRFIECPVENVPVLYDDCGCDDNGCAPNRILESYAFDVTVDPPLALLPAIAPADLAGAMFARAPGGMLAAKTPRFGIAPLVGSSLYALDAAKPQTLVAYDLTTRHAGMIDLGADAMALAARGNFVFVATGPKGGTPEVIQVFASGATTPVATVDITATTSASTVALVATSDPTRAAVVYVRDTGALLAYAEDTANGLKAASSSLGSIAGQLSGFVALPDGTGGYAIDEAGGKVKAITFAAASTTGDVSALPATARPTALAVADVGGKHLIAIVSRTQKTLFIVDAANATAAAGLLATIPLDQTPEFIAAGAQGTVYVFEESGGVSLLQAIDLAPLSAGQAAVLSAPRAVNGPGLRLIELLANATAGVIASGDEIDMVCAELIWNQTCGGCDTPNCLTLATIERYQAGAEVLDADTQPLADDIANQRARIDNRTGRRILASTQTLQAWLECLQTKGTQGPKGDKGDKGEKGEKGDPGVGTQGPPGLGLYVDLPKILDIGWRFEARFNFLQFFANYIFAPTAAVNPADEIRKRVKDGKNVPPLTVYFNKPMTGITRRTFEVTIDAPFVLPQGKQQTMTSAGVYFPFDLKIYGDIIEVPGGGPTPHTGENAPYAVSFLPRPQFFSMLDKNDQPTAGAYLLVWYLVAAATAANVDLPRLMLSLRGDFVYALDANGKYTEFGVLDGENIGGMVGEPPPAKRMPPIQGGLNPSGNLTQGGLFESWLFLTQGDTQGRMSEEEKENMEVNLPAFSRVGPAMLGLDGLPPTANLATPQAIVEATGVSDAVARRIVEERQHAPFTAVADFRTRARISERDWAKLKGKLLIL
jgi:hypothetical protein